MKVEYDPKYDLMNIEFIPEEPIAESLELEGLVIDYNQDGRIVAIEILDASSRTKSDPLGQLDFSVIREKAAV